MLITNKEGINSLIDIFDDNTSNTKTGKTTLDCIPIDYSNSFFNDMNVVDIQFNYTVTLSGVESGFWTTFEYGEITATLLKDYGLEYSNGLLYIVNDIKGENIRVEITDTNNTSVYVIPSPKNTRKYFLNNIPYSLSLIGSTTTEIVVYGFNNISDICILNDNGIQGRSDSDDTFKFSMQASSFISAKQLDAYKLCSDTITNPESIFLNIPESFESSYSFNDYISIYADSNNQIRVITANGRKALNYKYLVIRLDDCVVNVQSFSDVIGSVSKDSIPFKDMYLTKDVKNSEQFSTPSNNIYHYFGSGPLLDNKQTTVCLLETSLYYRPSYIKDVEQSFIVNNIYNKDRTKVARVEATTDNNFFYIKNIIIYQINNNPATSVTELYRLNNLDILKDYKTTSIEDDIFCFIDENTLGLTLFKDRLDNYSSITVSVFKIILTKTDNNIGILYSFDYDSIKGTLLLDRTYYSLPSLKCNGSTIVLVWLDSSIRYYNINTKDLNIIANENSSVFVSNINNPSNLPLFVICKLSTIGGNNNGFNKTISTVNFDTNKYTVIDTLNTKYKLNANVQSEIRYSDYVRFIDNIIVTGELVGGSYKSGLYSISLKEDSLGKLSTVGYDNIDPTQGCSIVGLYNNYIYLAVQGYLYRYSANSFTDKVQLLQLDQNIQYIVVIDSNRIICSNYMSTETNNGFSITYIGN